MDISSIWPDIQPDMWLFSVSGIRRDIRQDKSCIQPDTGYKKRPDYLVGRNIRRFPTNDTI
jgi:hypothetical protein